MKNKIKYLITLMAAIVMMTAFAVPAYAQVPDSVNASADAAPTESEEPKTEDKEKDKKEESKPLTPDGNLTLVDDITVKDDSEKQFLTVVSKNGNYFYIIVDRADNGENNVHFLNLVDERDLEDLIDGELSIDKEPEPVISVPEPVTPEPVVEQEPEPEPQKGLGGGAIFGGIILLLALAGGGFYYFKFVKPKNDNGNLDELSEFDIDDEEDEDDEPEVEIVKEEDHVPNFFKERETSKNKPAISIVEDSEEAKEEKTREEIIEELFGGDEE